MSPTGPVAVVKPERGEIFADLANAPPEELQYVYATLIAARAHRAVVRARAEWEARTQEAEAAQRRSSDSYGDLLR